MARLTHREAGNAINYTAKPFKWTLSGAVAELLLVAAFVLVNIFVYESYWTNIASGKEQSIKEEQVETLFSSYQNPRGAHIPALGEAFSRIYIPSFGTDFSFAIVEGTADEDLLAGPGHYDNTQMPGEAGNFAVAGHRVGKGSPFNDLGKLNTCDSIVIETQTSWYTYKVLPMAGDTATRQQAASQCLTPAVTSRVTKGDYATVEGRHITTPEQYEVVNPIPSTDTPLSPDMLPILTLTTCHPQFSNKERMIIHAVLTESVDKSSGQIPEALQA